MSRAGDALGTRWPSSLRRRLLARPCTARLGLRIAHPHVHLRALVLGVDLEHFAPFAYRGTGVAQRKKRDAEQKARRHVFGIGVFGGFVLLASAVQVAGVAVQSAEPRSQIRKRGAELYGF